MNDQLVDSKENILDFPKSFPGTYKYVLNDFNGDFTLSNIENYLKNLEAEKKPASIKVAKSALKAFVKAKSNDPKELAIIDVLFNRIKVPKPEKKVYKERILDQKSLSNYQNIDITPKARLLFDFLLCTGTRVSEALSIKIKDCVGSKDFVYISLVGKRKKERRIFVEKKIFEEIRSTYNGATWLFEGSSGLPISRQYVHRVIKQVGTLIGFENLHPHTLRHTFATTTLTEKGVSLSAVSNYLGHSTTAITADLYIHDEIEPSDIFS